MNTIYRLVWSHRLQAMIVAPEFAKGKGKGGLVSKAVVVAGGILLASQSALAFSPIGSGATSATVTSPGAAGNLVIGDNASATNTTQSCGNTTDILGNPYLNGGCASSTVIGNNATNNGYASSLVLGEGAQVTGVGSTALGNLSTAADNSLAAGFQSEALGIGSTALGQGSTAAGMNSVAIGKGAFTSGSQSIALGINAGRGEGANPIIGSTFGNQGDNISIGDTAGNNVLGAKNLAFGNYSGTNVSGNENITFGASSGSNVYGFDNVSIGPNSGSNINGGVGDTGNNNTAVGPHAGNNIVGGGNVALGQDAGNNVNANQTVSIGHVANAGGDGSIAIGNNSTVGAGVFNSIAQGTSASVTGNSSIGIGQKANVSGSQSVTLGYNSVVAGSNAGNLGVSSTINGNNSYAVGNNNKIDSSNVVALGNGITIASGLDNAVALGAGASVASAVGTSSTTLNGTTYSFAGSSPIATVSVGATGKERTLTNLAAGRINSLSTDAVNGSQLFATNTALSALDSGAVKYDLNTDGTVNYNSVTLGGPAYNSTTHTGGTTITNVADGVAPSDAVNFSQLTQTNNQVANIYNTGTKYFHANSTGTDSSALGLDAVAIGLSAVATHANDVALGANSATGTTTGTSGVTLAGANYLFAGTTPTSQVSVGSVGNERLVTNVAAGSLSATSTDAVNGSQLFATNTALNALDAGAVKYDTNTDGSVNYNSITLGGNTYDNSTHTGGTTITNVADGVAPSDAVNFSQLTQTNNQVANIYNTGTKYFHANSTGTDSSALGLDAVAIGLSAVATHANDVALGANSATGTTTGTSGVTLAGANYLFAGTTPTSQVSVGSAGNERLLTNVAAGNLSAASTDAVNGSQLFATNTALNNLNTNLDALDAGSVKYDTNTDGSVNYNSITLGGNTYDNSTHTGGTTITNVADGVAPSDAVNFSQLTQTNNQVANIYNTGTKYFHANSTGTDSSALGLNAVAIGQSAVANNANDVALGANAITGTTAGTSGTTLLGTNYLFAGVAPTSQVSVGSAGNERLVTNVAAGSLSSSSTDAVNGSQLYATNTALNTLSGNLGTLDAGAVKYDTNIDGSVNYNSITLGGNTYDNSTHTGGTTITNVADGVAPSDAVNFSQLTQTNNQVANIYNTGTKYFHANSTGTDSSALGQDAVAIGQSAVANNANDVALGANSVTGTTTGTSGVTLIGTDYAFAGAAPTSQVSVGSAGNERLVTNVAAGSLSSSSTDAVNGSQLYATNTALNSINTAVGSLQQDALLWDSSLGAFSASHGGTTVNKITNVAAGTLSSTSTDAVNGSQLYATNQNISNLDSRVTNVENANRYVKVNSTGAAADAQGTDAVAVGQGTNASGNNSVAIGNGAASSANNAVALGAGSVADRANSVSVGSQGNERQITNVAAGTEDTDAVNLAQLRAATGDIVNIENTAKNISNGRDGMFQVNNSSNLSKPTVTGNDAVAGGAGAEASGNNSTALGTRSKATANNSVALGSDSVADRANTVSVGSAGHERQITNVAAGTQGTDAVNLNQLNKGISSANQYTDKRFNDLKNMVDDNNDKLSAGIAGAMAMAALPQPYSAGGSMVGLGGGTYQGQSAVALGVSTISDNGKWVTKLSGTTNSKGDVGAAIGVGYQW